MSIAQPAGLLCPRCEKPLKSHQDGECPHKKPTRRSFFGALFGAAAAAVVVPKLAVNATADFGQGETFWTFQTGQTFWTFQKGQTFEGDLLTWRRVDGIDMNMAEMLDGMADTLKKAPAGPGIRLWRSNWGDPPE